MLKCKPLFFMIAAGLETCNYCEEDDVASCNKRQGLQVCSMHPALGKTHCGSVVGKYLDRDGKEEDLFYRGCFNCAGELTLAKARRLIRRTSRWPNFARTRVFHPGRGTS